MNNAFWITPKGEIINPDIRHIGSILKNPRKFGETDKTIKDTYNKYDEPVSATVEGKAREEIMQRVIKRGFIRVRFGGSRRNQKWSIQLTKLTSKVEDILWLWARKVIDSRIATDSFADVVIHELSSNKMTKTSLNKVASGGSIKECSEDHIKKIISQFKIYREDELYLLEDYFDYAEKFFDQLHEDAQQELVDRGYINNMIRESDQLDESSLSRIFTHINQEGRSFGVISPFRSELPTSENEERYKELKRIVKSLGYGFIEMQGGFKEEEGFTFEKSLFIPNITREVLVNLGIKYDQYSVIYKDDNEFVEIGTNKNSGIKKIKNRFQFKDRNSIELAQEVMKDFFSKLIKGSHRGKKFLFKLQEKEVNSFNRAAYGNRFLKWLTIYEEGKMNNLNESSLSRLYRHNEKHDCGALTAFRKARDCGEGELYTYKERRQRNKSLLAKLMAKGYSVTKLKGKYPEGGKTSVEESFFVVDIKDIGNLEKDLIKLGEEFEQDSVLIIPKGSVIGEDKAYLIGTNKCPNNWLGYHKKEYFEKGKFGYQSKIYTSYVDGRPFIFEDVEGECKQPSSGMGVWALHLISKKDWEDIEL